MPKRSKKLLPFKIKPRKKTSKKLSKERKLQQDSVKKDNARLKKEFVKRAEAAKKKRLDKPGAIERSKVKKFAFPKSKKKIKSQGV